VVYATVIIAFPGMLGLEANLQWSQSRSRVWSRVFGLVSSWVRLRPRLRPDHCEGQQRYCLDIIYA